MKKFSDNEIRKIAKNYADSKMYFDRIRQNWIERAFADGFKHRSKILNEEIRESDEEICPECKCCVSEHRKGCSEYYTGR